MYGPMKPILRNNKLQMTNCSKFQSLNFRFLVIENIEIISSQMKYNVYFGPFGDQGQAAGKDIGLDASLCHYGHILNRR